MHTNGTFQGLKRFDCPSGKAFFTKTKKCKVDRRFCDDSAVEQSGILKKNNISVMYTSYILCCILLIIQNNVSENVNH